MIKTSLYSFFIICFFSAWPILAQDTAVDVNLKNTQQGAGSVADHCEGCDQAALNANEAVAPLKKIYLNLNLPPEDIAAILHDSDRVRKFRQDEILKNDMSIANDSRKDVKPKTPQEVVDEKLEEKLGCTLRKSKHSTKVLCKKKF